jgi:hypothetical protein
VATRVMLTNGHALSGANRAAGHEPWTHTSLPIAMG